jgi:hypothetical protein
VLPGWQKWKPTYRVGTLTDKDDDMNMGTVDFDVARSTVTGIPRATRENKAWPYGGDAAGLLINQEDPGWIEFEYMECDSLAFETGDRVLVEFRGQDWTAPMIIGFESHPKYCQTFCPRLYNLGQRFVDLGTVVTVTGDVYHYEQWWEFEWWFGGIKVKGPFHWSRQDWSAVYETVLCQDCWRDGAITFSDGYIDVWSTETSLVVGVRASRAPIIFSSNPSIPEQYQDGGLCANPGGNSTIDYCAVWDDPSVLYPGDPTRQEYANTITIPATGSLVFHPLGSPGVDEIIALFSIPATNFFDPSHEYGRAVLTGIEVSFVGGWRIYGHYEPPEDDYVPPDP